MRKLYLTVIGLLLSGVLLFLTGQAVAQASNANESCRVTKVVDGDTFWATCNGKAELVRILWVNTPDIGRSECYARTAARFTAGHLLNKSVVLKGSGTTRDDIDRHGRALRQVFLNGQDFGERLVHDGYAIAWFLKQAPLADAQRLATTQYNARVARVGEWGACTHQGGFSSGAAQSSLQFGPTF